VSYSEYPGTENDANAALANLLPEKSSQVYEYACQRFKTRCDEKNGKEAVTEKVLVTYFVNKAKQQKSPTLWSR
jgi:hypothetical protein